MCATKFDACNNKRVGDRFEFGRYPQGANGEVQPITWRVLERDSDSVLVIAEQGLDAKCYNGQRCGVTWADCTLRRWLNEEFFKEAFNEQERSLIKTSNLANNTGPSTEDRIFLLSVDEAKSFFATDNDRACKPTNYAVKNGAYKAGSLFSFLFGGIAGNAWWWLRSSGYGNLRAAVVFSSGGIGDNGDGVIRSDGSVRPDLRLAL